ncbi:MAG: hypothetical protein ACFB6R_12960 [Alphaproteobacteria bacterium]
MSDQSELEQFAWRLIEKAREQECDYSNGLDRYELSLGSYTSQVLAKEFETLQLGDYSEYIILDEVDGFEVFRVYSSYREELCGFETMMDLDQITAFQKKITPYL